MAPATMVGPATKPSKPKTSSPPRQLINSSNSLSRVRLLSSIGRTILSTTVATPPQIASTAIALPQCPCNPSHAAAGTQISADPTTGTSEKNAISTPQNSVVGIPVSAKDTPPSVP